MDIVRAAATCLTALLLPAVTSPDAAGASAPKAQTPPAAQTRSEATAPTRLMPAKATGMATARGSVRGYASRDFVIHAGAGQTLTVSFGASSPSAYFNLLPPGSSVVAMFIGSTTGHRYQGVAPIAGDYTARVYLMRSAARRNAASGFTLKARVAGTALVPLPAREDAVLPGTPFHAGGPVPCALPYQPDVRQCDARVIRYDHAGTVTVELRGPRDFVRRILFVKGTPTASDATEPLASTRIGDTTTVTIGTDERYELPDALIVGG